VAARCSISFFMETPLGFDVLKAQSVP